MVSYLASASLLKYFSVIFISCKTSTLTDKLNIHSMNFTRSIFVLLLLFSSTGILAEPVNRIAFGSCLHQDKPQFIWDSIRAQKPDIFLFMGDNIYADTKDMNLMQAKYNKLAAHAEFGNFRKHIPIYAVWDDHDYGRNDAGEEYPAKVQSEQIFLDFFKVPANAATKSRPGIYDAHLFGTPNKSVQVILLDTRYFRGPTVQALPDASCPKKNYRQQLNPDVSLLGEEQWIWLREQLLKPAQVRLIVSSIQVIPDQHCWEKWANFPLQRQKLFDLIASTHANGVVFLSGDRHLAEVSKIDIESIGYPLYEVTSSGMNTKIYGRGEQNKYRLAPENVQENNFGMIEFNWQGPASSLEISLFNDRGEPLFHRTVLLSDLSGTLKREQAGRQSLQLN